VAWAEVCLHTKWHLDLSSRLATIDQTTTHHNSFTALFP